MAKIPKEVQEFLTGKMAWVAKAAADGMPNATPKGSDQLIDEKRLQVHANSLTCAPSFQPLPVAFSEESYFHNKLC
jgi:hypothetical protein